MLSDITEELEVVFMLSDKELEEVCTSIEKMAEMNDVWSVFPRRQLYGMFQELRDLRKVAEAAKPILEDIDKCSGVGQMLMLGYLREALAEWEARNG